MSSSRPGGAVGGSHVRAFSVAAFVSVLASGACAEGMIVAEYPTTESPLRGPPKVCPDAGLDEVTASDAACRATGRYWSAFVNLEVQDIPRLWKTTALDYALISARATLPTRNGPIVRDFPLYTIADGQVLAESGADLLRKFPISQTARDQVTITLTAKFVKDKKALDIVRKVIQQASKAAEPYLGNYPVASQLVGAAVPIVDELLDTDSIKPSSTATALRPELLTGDHDLKAYLIVPIEAMKASEYTYRAPLVECSDMPGRLCTGSAAPLTYQRNRVRDVAYLTISFQAYDDVFDPMILLGGARSDCGLLTTAALQKARDYLAANEDLFSADDVDAARVAFSIADEALRRRELVVKGDLGALIDRLEAFGQDASQKVKSNCSAGATLCGELDNIANCVDDPGRSPTYEAWQVWNLYHRQDPQCPAERGSRDAIRLDLLDAALDQLATVAGQNYSRDDKNWQTSSGSIVRLLRHEALDLAVAQKADAGALDKGPCTSAEDASRLARRASLSCDTCWKTLEARCAGSAAGTLALKDAREARKALIQQLLQGSKSCDAK